MTRPRLVLVEWLDSDETSGSTSDPHDATGGERDPMSRQNPRPHTTWICKCRQAVLVGWHFCPWCGRDLALHGMMTIQGDDPEVCTVPPEGRG